MNPKLLVVIKREYLQQVRNKAFWIATTLIPTFAVAAVIVNVAINKNLAPTGRIGIVDLTGRLYEPLLTEQKRADSIDAEEEKEEKKDEAKKSDGKKAAGVVATPTLELFKVEATPETLPSIRKKLNEDVQKERIKAYVVLDSKTLETGMAEWRAQSVKADFIMRSTVASLLERAVTKERLKDQGVDPSVYDTARVVAKLDPHEAKEIESAESKNLGFNIGVSVVLFFLIYASIFMYGAFVMRGVLEEKNNRIVEVIVSSVRPTDLMLGKIIGIGLVGLTQYAIWGLLALNLSSVILGFTGLGRDLPPIPFGIVAAFVGFFLLAYFLYASLYAALAAPFNTEQEAQQFIMIPMMILVLTSMTWFFVFNSPNGRLAQVLSFFPFTSPLIMFMRVSVQTPPMWQIATSVGMLLLTIWLVAWFAGRIYRVGILMYGKKPTLPEIWRWAMAAD